MNRSSHHFDRPTRSVSRFAAPTALGVALILLSGCAEDAAPISEHGAPDASMEAEVGSVVDEISGDDPVGGPVIYYESGEDTISSGSYVVDGDELIVEGDISLGTREEAWAVHVELATEVRESRHGNKNLMDTRPRRLWDGGVIHYDFDDHFKCSSDSDASSGCARRRMIDDAIKVWNELRPLTGLHWVYKSLRLRDSGARFYYNGADGGCSSSVGRHQWRRRLKLGADCFTPGIIQHEMGHQMGLFHEHQRDDRYEHVWFDRGALDSDYWQYRQHSRRPRKYREIGSYDPNSLMHYGTLFFAWGALPVMTNMEVWDMYNPVGGMGSIPTMTESREWNFAPRLDGRGFGFDPVVSSWRDTTIVEESTFRVLDVDANGFDDIVASSDEGVMWSVRGASGWIPLSVDGGLTHVDADIHAIAIGNLDSNTGLDAVALTGTGLDLYSSAGGKTHIALPWAASDVQVAELTGDTFDDVFLVHSGRWARMIGGAALGSPVDFAPDMGVAQVAIERLDGAELNVVSIGADLQLQRSSIAVPMWVPIGVRVPTAAQGLLSRVWFCDLDAPRASGEPMDIVVPDDRGNPLVAIDPTSSATPVLTRLPSNGSFAVNLQQSLAGHFSSQRTSFVTYGVLSQRIPNDERIRRSDLSGFIRSYEPFDSALITYRYPMPVQPEAGFTTPVGMNVVAGERIEIAMDIAAGGGVRSFERIVELGTTANGPWTIDERATHALGGGHVETARFVFDECRTGFWRVTLAPLDPAVDVSLLQPSRLSFAPLDLATTDDAASWIFNVTASPVPLTCTKGGGPVPRCGNGAVEGAEACDDGNVVDGDSCTAVCTVPRCGDGHVSSAETCDDGNTVDGDACPATCTTSMCGNGVVEPGEQCDDGANFPSCYGAGTCAMCLYCLE